ncbi:ABC transporter ATP-binding protein [Ochrobactrum sp. XJ1]|nr:ABC transporter ATP-binding protein [Ochrobactrum sp. XJ1]
MNNLLKVEDLKVAFSTRRGTVEAISGVSFSLAKGETLGLVGESGSGKSVTAYAISRLLDRAGKITNGRILFQGHDITRASDRELREVRGASMSMIFQNPRAALNPIRTIGQQLADTLRAHGQLTARQARDKALDLLDGVMIRNPAERMNAYPHELSGGMCQRVMIAMAIACEPDLLIADEPTTGLDVTTQKVVMDMLAVVAARRGMATILITHDLGLAAQYCGNIAVMERGLLVERGQTAELFRNPRHTYTQRLIGASPTPSSTISDLAQAAITAGEPLSPEPLVVKPQQDLPSGRPLLEVKGLRKDYDVSVKAVDDVSFAIPAGGSLGLVGESGSGKSTLSRLICRLVDKTAGEILFDGKSIGDIAANIFHKSPQRRDIQIVFQDPNESLNPRFTAYDCIAHPLRTLDGLRPGNELRSRVQNAARRCGLSIELLSRFPHQLSGGQKARVGIARALVSSPRLLVLDEPTAALDVSVQAIILTLLDRLRREDGITYLFVSHDLNVVRMMCEQVVVLRHGKIVEESASQSLFDNPATDYTRELIAAIPHFRPSPISS